MNYLRSFLSKRRKLLDTTPDPGSDSGAATNVGELDPSDAGSATANDAPTVESNFIQGSILKDAVNASSTKCGDHEEHASPVNDASTEHETDVLEICVNDDIDLILPSSDSENEAQLPSGSANSHTNINGSNESTDSSSENDDSESSESDSDDSDGAQSVSDFKDMLNDEDEEAISGPIVSANEVIDEAAPTLPQGYCIPEDAPIELVGTITGLVEQSMIIKGNSSGEYRVLDEELVLCMADRTPVGLLFETFGRLLLPFYRVKFATPAEFGQFKDTKGKQIYSVVPDSKFIFTDTIRIKGCDASNVHDEELPEHERDFSDDENERLAKRDRKLKRKSKKTSHEDSGPVAPSAGSPTEPRPVSKYPQANYGVAGPSVPTYVPRTSGAANTRGTRAPIPAKPVFDTPSSHHTPSQLPVSLAHSQMLDFEQQQHGNFGLQKFNQQPPQLSYSSQPSQTSYNPPLSQPGYSPQPTRPLYGGQNTYASYGAMPSQTYQEYQPPAHSQYPQNILSAAHDTYGAHSPYGVPFNSAQQFSSNTLHHQHIMPQQSPALNKIAQILNSNVAAPLDAPQPLGQEQLAELQRLVLKKLDESEQNPN